MGLRGPQPRHDATFRGRPVVVGPGGFPSIRWPEHPLARELATGGPPGAPERGVINIHRLVASEMHGRALTRKEHVRWRDGDVWNWDPSNLVVARADEPLAKYQQAAQRAAARGARKRQ